MHTGYSSSEVLCTLSTHTAGLREYERKQLCWPIISNGYHAKPLLHVYTDIINESKELDIYLYTENYLNRYLESYTRIVS